MIFKRLEVFGFKSFADKCMLQFEPGVTAIVGPNGCGKSNISDAIRWVLGEQSARVLRGARMEDVIFNGTDNKSAVNLAEVSLVLSNEKKLLPLDYDEVTVTRRIFRSGESEYLLNKTPVRLKDISELFMDTGIGTEAYSLIEQGKIDQILSSRPEERREVFEEAAGITKYKTKKKEALRKLEQTEVNLLRVNDIITEVGRQVSSVERHAQKAARYKEEFEKLKTLETKFNLIEFRKTIYELDGLKARLDEMANSEKVKVEENTGLQSRLAEVRLQMARQDEELASIRRRHSAVIHQIDKDKSHLPIIRDRMDELKSRSESITKEISVLQEKIVSLKDEEDKTKRETVILIEEKERKEKLKEEKFAEQDRLTSDIHACSDKIGQCRVELVDVASRQSKVHNELTRIASETQGLCARIRRLSSEKEESATLLKDAEEKFYSSQNQRDELKSKVDTLRQERKAMESGLKHLHEELAVLKQSLVQLRENLAGLNSKREFLEDLKKRYEGFGAGVKALLKEKDLGTLKWDGFYGPLANIIEVERGFEQALESVLGNKVESLVVENFELACELLDYLKKNHLGEASVFYLNYPWQETVQGTELSLEEVQPELLSAPGVKGKAVDFVKSEHKFLPLLSNLLKKVVIVENLDTAMNLHRRDTACIFVTIDGEVLRHGSISGGFRFSPADAGLIGREVRIRELASACQHLQGELAKVEDEEKSKNNALQDSETSMGQLADSTHQLEIELTNADSRLSSVLQEKKRLEEEISLISLELSEAEDEETHLKEAEEKQKALLSELQDANTRLEKVVIETQEQIKIFTERRENLLIENATLQTEVGALQERLARAESAHKVLTANIIDQEGMSKQKTSELEECSQKNEELNTEEARLEEEIKSLTIEEENVKKEEGSSASHRQDIVREMGGLESQINAEQKVLEGLRNEIRDQELKSNEKEYLVQGMRERMLANYHVDLNEVQIEIEPDLDLVRLRDEMEELRKKIEGMGPVNLAAVEEHKELQERFAFLTGQQTDLVNAKESLLKAIQKINQTTKELFINTFKRIQETFQEFYRLLFGGGEAEIILVGEEDILEAGVDIIARPPGKKPQSISLLSGGEKALTAIALLFAIFKVKPSPFCVLDEIDAPLDEANVDRFTRVLQEFVKTSQFIIITHNKKTIGMADVMYGVTMEESGISKIVSVKFKDGHRSKQVES